MVKTRQNNTNKLVNRIIKSINEDLSDIYDDDDTFMFDEDIEDDERLTDEEDILYHFGEDAAEDMGYGPYEEDDEDDYASYIDVMNELERMGYNEGDSIPAGDLYKAIHKVGFPWEREYDEAEFEDQFNVTIDWNDDNSVNESAEDQFYDAEGNWDPIDDEDYEDPYYDAEGNWDPVDDDDEDDSSMENIHYICDIVGQFQYIDFNDMNGPIHLNNENIDIESIENQGEDADDEDIEIVDTNGDIHDIEEFDEDDIATLAQAVGEYAEFMGDDY